MKLQMDSGNFSTLVEIEVDGEREVGEGENASTVNEVLVAAGLRYIGEREGLGEVYKELGGKMNDKGKLALPKGFVRTSVPFSESNATRFAKVLQGVFEQFGEAEVKVVQYVAPESDSGLKKATALYDAAKTKGVLPGLAAALNYSGDQSDAGKDAFIAHIHAVKYAKKDAASELAEMGM